MDFSQPQTLLGGLTAAEFLRDYWQKKPLLVRAAMPDFVSPIEADEVGGLALEEEVESRLLQQNAKGALQLQHGPFSERELQKLPASGWTLLVQAVDQFVPEVAALLERFAFLPRWRMDDVMISLAAPGGTVGAHFDQYDVFLLQGSGKKRWQIGGKCTDSSEMLPHPELKLLKDMPVSEEYLLEPGDMLYLPPQLAHCGTAEGDGLGMTFSIGFRAPSAAEVISHFSDFFAQHLSEHQRYSDADSEHCADSGRIGADVLPRLKALLAPLLEDDELLLRWFGQFMTEPRYPERLFAAEASEKTLLQQLKRGSLLQRSASARLAFAETADGALLFASGQSRLLPKAVIPLLSLLCRSQSLSAATLGDWLKSAEARALLCALVEQGSLEFAGE